MSVDWSQLKNLGGITLLIVGVGIWLLPKLPAMFATAKKFAPAKRTDQVGGVKLVDFDEALTKLTNDFRTITDQNQMLSDAQDELTAKNAELADRVKTLTNDNTRLKSAIDGLAKSAAEVAT